MTITTTLKARTGRGFPLKAGETITVRNTHGVQVVDTWAVCLDEGSHVLSLAHTRVINGKITVAVGDTLYDDARRPVLKLVRDTSPGTHDTLIPACDPARYESLGHVGRHDNCRDNFRTALRAAGLAAVGRVPAPLNLFMNVPIDTEGRLTFAAPASRPGDAVTFEALADLVVVLSACPQDLLPVNGELLTPQDVEVETSSRRAPSPRATAGS